MVNTPVKFLCSELRSIRKGTSERRGTGELCKVMIVASRPQNVFIVSSFACRNATSYLSFLPFSFIFLLERVVEKVGNVVFL